METSLWCDGTEIPLPLFSENKVKEGRHKSQEEKDFSESSGDVNAARGIHKCNTHSVTWQGVTNGLGHLESHWPLPVYTFVSANVGLI